MTRADGRDAAAPVLSVDRLFVRANTSSGPVDLVEGLSLEVRPGEVTALVGESGCGKSMTSLAVMGLLPPGVGVAGGEIRLRGRRVDGLGEDEYIPLRGKIVSMIFQEPMSSLNPLMTAGDQVAEVYRISSGMAAREARGAAVEMLSRVRIPEPARRAEQYPHQMSGGMRQRVMIAMALAASPSLLIADEPTTALDVTIQAQILELLLELVADRDASGDPMGVLLITHDMGVVAETADRIVVMYAGREVESGTVADVFAKPRHPYTRGLFDAIPRIEGGEIRAIPGVVPRPGARPRHCAFADRCPHVLPECRAGEIPLVSRGDVLVRCLREEFR